MPMRTKDGLVHLVKSPSARDFHGLLQCNVMYQVKHKNAQWTTHATKSPDVYGYPLVRARPSQKRVTCLGCLGARAKAR